jgi:hypothetical protein
MYLRLYIAVLFLLTVVTGSNGQVTDSSSINIYTRLSFYTLEKSSELLVHIPSPLIGILLDISVQSGDIKIKEWIGSPTSSIIRIPFNLNDSLKPGKISAYVKIRNSGSVSYYAECSFSLLPHKVNEVKIDRLTGGLIVNNLPFFPFGFYCYSPVQPTLPEEEVVKGFNLISPYQRILPETFSERKAYMDRCAQIGMKVNYNLLSVSGGGGVNSSLNGFSDEQKRELLISEIKAIMDHPALLAWYISDEPNGSKIPPETIEEIYRVVKETDPWHPVSVVFMAPFTPASKYTDGLDIVMADPYPIPDYPVTVAGDAAALLKKEFNGRNPVWIVPQAFGGGENWKREPTIQEIRSMTYQAIIKGATGIQYFIRNGLNSFPKSSATWGECGRMSLEINSITPWLLSDEETIPVLSASKKILVSSKMSRGQLIIMAANTANEPVYASFSMGRNFNGKAMVIFENRSVKISGGTINDILPALGTQVYRIDIDPHLERFQSWSGNLILDGGFEDITSPGVPSACYARPAGDRGATYFLDPRERIEGNYSLRLVTPDQGKGVNIRFFPVKVKSGYSYIVSLWAKADPGQRFKAANKLNTQAESSLADPQYVEAGMGEFGMGRFIPTPEWKQYITIVTIPSDTLPEIKANVILRMPGQGVAWFDMLQVIEDPLGIKN